MIYKVGITGGIGAGKSTVSSIFRILGIPVYQADIRAKELMSEDLPLRYQLVELLGDETFKDGRLNRNFIAGKIFSDRWTLEKLNSLVHPVVEKDYLEWHKTQYSVPYTINEAALLFDNGRYLTIDAIIHVSATEEIRIQRVQKRDELDRTSIIARIRNQWPEDRRCQMADYIIKNNGDLLVPQVLQIHQELKKLVSKN